MPIVTQFPKVSDSPTPTIDVLPSGAGASATSRHAQFSEHGRDVAGRSSAGLVKSAISGREADSPRDEAWRAAVTRSLYLAGLGQDAIDFADCGRFMGNFQVVACESHTPHDVKAIPFHCHRRFCPDCERVQQATKVARYVPILQQIAERKRPGWALKKIVLSTPYALNDPDGPALYRKAWKFFEQWQQLVYRFALSDELTPGEVRRGRVDYQKHDVGSLVSSEFGERGKKLHFHATMYLPYVGQERLAAMWQEASGGVCQVMWIKRIGRDQVQAELREQIKYITKFSELPPSLVPALVKVLDGSRRFRTYGIVRGQPVLEDRKCKCKICAGKMVLMKVTEYFELMDDMGEPPDANVEQLAEQSLIYLQFKPCNKAGEATIDGQHLARSDPDSALHQMSLPSVDALIKPFDYQ